MSWGLRATLSVSCMCLVSCTWCGFHMLSYIQKCLIFGAILAVRTAKTDVFFYSIWIFPDDFHGDHSSDVETFRHQYAIEWSLSNQLSNELSNDGHKDGERVSRGLHFLPQWAPQTTQASESCWHVCPMWSWCIFYTKHWQKLIEAQENMGEYGRYGDSGDLEIVDRCQEFVYLFVE